jgi:hypothetical protein
MDIDIDDLLSNWYKAKQEICLLEQKCEKYKKVSEKIMSQSDKNTLNTSSYSLKKIDINIDLNTNIQSDDNIATHDTLKRIQIAENDKLKA